MTEELEHEPECECVDASRATGGAEAGYEAEESAGGIHADAVS